MTPAGSGAGAGVRRILVTGGVRSGKSAHAESLLWDRAATYLATGSTRRDDASWLARVAAHQQRRPSLWTSVESLDVPSVLDELRTPCLLDDVGSWLTATLEECGAWEDDAREGSASWRAEYEARADAFVAAVETCAQDLVIVTGEVGFGLVSRYHSGRVFTDELGLLNQRLARVCDEVVLVVAGCPLVVKGDAVANGDSR